MNAKRSTFPLILQSLIAVLVLVACSSDEAGRGAAWVTGVQKNLENFITADADPLAKICGQTPALPPGATASCAADHMTATITYGAAAKFPYDAPQLRGLEAERLTCADGSRWYEGNQLENLECLITIDPSKKMTMVWNLIGDIFALPSYAGKLWLGGHFAFSRTTSADKFQYSCDESTNDAYVSSQPDMTKVKCESWTAKFSSMAACTRSGVDP